MIRSGVVARVDLRGVVVLDEAGRTFAAAVRKRLQDPGARLGNAIVVGDRVRCEVEGSSEAAEDTATGARDGIAEGTAAGAVVVAIEPRANRFERRAAGEPGRGDSARGQVLAANLDQVLIVAALRRPPLREGLLDRFLVAAEHFALAARIVIAKADLASAEEVEAARSIYVRAGYPAHAVAAQRGLGVDEVERALRGRRTLVVGHSGVGKSTLLNALSPGLGLRIGEVNLRTGKGRHTTTAALLLRLDAGPPATEVIDTPGVRTFGLPPIPPAALADLFPEWRDLPPCRFGDCSHRAEPGCARIAAVRAGRMSEDRYQSYLKLRGEQEEALAR